MKDRSIGDDDRGVWIGAGLLILALFIGLICGWTICGNYSLAQAPAAVDPAPDLAGLEARADSALDEIRTLYQGMTVLASWYGTPYHGRPASNGEIYDMTRDTVAHRTLPLGTIVVLENMKNGRLAIGRVTDRGPYVDGRALDVSLAIADELDMVYDGLATVRMWAVRIPTGEMVAGRVSEGD